MQQMQANQSSGMQSSGDNTYHCILHIKKVKVGKKVLLSSKTLYLAGTKKLWARFVGPFRVLERVGKTAYRLDLRGRFKDIQNVLHIS